jgi:hypothetical protein
MSCTTLATLFHTSTGSVECPAFVSTYYVCLSITTVNVYRSSHKPLVKDFARARDLVGSSMAHELDTSICIVM